VIALVLIGLPLTNHVRIVRACHDKSIIFVTRVKVILHTPRTIFISILLSFFSVPRLVTYKNVLNMDLFAVNYLQVTDISSVTFEPMMPEVLALRHR
jgi:hypothetical protein